MKKALKKIDFGGVLIGVAASGAGAVAAAATNKIEFVQQHLDTPLKRGISKLVIGASLPVLAQLIGKKISPAIMHGITSFSDGFVAIGAVEVANATMFKDAPVALSGITPFATLSGTNDLYPVQQFNTLQNQDNNPAKAAGGY